MVIAVGTFAEIDAQEDSAISQLLALSYKICKNMYWLSRRRWSSRRQGAHLRTKKIGICSLSKTTVAPLFPSNAFYYARQTSLSLLIVCFVECLAANSDPQIDHLSVNCWLTVTVMRFRLDMAL
jgi:hypothetical protein